MYKFNDNFIDNFGSESPFRRLCGPTDLPNCVGDYTRRLISGDISPDVDYAGSGNFNLYPSNIPGILHPDFVGVCLKGTGCEDLRKVLIEACIHEEMCINQGMKYTSITILTDKWDKSIFEEFVKDFEFYAREDRCRINVMLLTGLYMDAVTIISAN